MASPRSTPFIASWETEDALDATAPLEELVAARPQPRPVAAGGPSRRAWSGIAAAGVLAAGALLWADGDSSRAPAVERPARVPPPPIRAVLQPIAARVDLPVPQVAFAKVAPPAPRIAQMTPQPRSELAAALLERRKQLSESDVAVADVDAVADIRFDPSRRSARVVYRAGNSAAEVVEYWAVRDGRWQPLN